MNSEADPQRLERKRHLGNDIVNVIFLEDVEPGQYFDPKWLVTNFTRAFRFFFADLACSVYLPAYPRESSRYLLCNLKRQEEDKGYW
jgi:hypothetical protein